MALVLLSDLLILPPVINFKVHLTNLKCVLDIEMDRIRSLEIFVSTLVLYNVVLDSYIAIE